MADADSPAERLVELENRTMHQERLLDELNAMVVEQGKQIDRLTRELTQLEAKVTAGGEEAGSHDEKPPHY